MNKQEFLGASLRTGLKVLHFDANRESEHICKIEIWHNKEVIISDGENEYDLLLDDLIPILRPLSDLTKPITHNGETFVPIAKLFKMPDSEVDIIFASEECVQFINKRTRCHYSFYVATIRLTEALKLIEWHFNLMSESEPFIPVTNQFNPYK